MVNVKMVPWLAVASALMVMASGCGGSANLVPVNGLDKSAKNITPSSDPIVVQPSPYIPNQNLPSPGAMPLQLPVTELSSDKNLWGNFNSVTFQVTNPSPQQVQGTLKVTFTNQGISGKKEHVKEQSISLGAGQTSTYTIKPDATADKAVAVVELLQGVGYDPHGGAYGQPTGGYY